MAVYKQSYRGYAGALMPDRHRIWVVHTFARRRVFRSRLLTTLYFLCLLVPLVELIAVYLASNLTFLSQIGGTRLLTIDNNFFSNYLYYSCAFAFLFTAFAAPGLVAPDLTQGALTLYLSRPLTRLEYLAGKFSVLFLMLSSLTWVPALVVFAVQCNLGGAAWRAQYLWMGPSLLFAALIWISVLSLLALATSAWVRWRIVAAGVLLGIDFLGAGFSQAVNAALGTKTGDLFSFMQLHVVIWTDMFRLPPLPLSLVVEAWVVVALVAAGSLALVLRRLRAFEVVK
ncbi:MAG: hypothetical protein ACRD01_13715 [Terriglobales bacterium]